MTYPAPSIQLLHSLSASLRRAILSPGFTAPLACQCGARRGKKKNAKARNDIWIKLLKDVPAYGRKGTIVPVPIGQMRNYFYPQNLADYVSMLQQRDMRRSNVVVERDATFGREIEAAAKEERDTPEAKVSRMSEPRTVDLKLLPAQKAYDLLTETIPLTMDFYRTPIAPIEARRASNLSTPVAPALDSAVTPPSAEIARAAAPPPDVSPRQSPDNIYGSVSTADIAVNIRALLQNGGMTGLIVLPDEDVKFVELGADQAEGEKGKEADRVKKLGEFAYEVRVKGLSEEEHKGMVRRMVRVLSDDEEEPANLGPPTTGEGRKMKRRF